MTASTFNKTHTEKQLWEILNEIPDPEVPVISIVELGVVRSISILDDTVVVAMTPTYSGCPALKAMEEQIVERLKLEGIERVAIKLIYKPAWTTDWLSDESKEKLRKYGIAPPSKITAAHLSPMSHVKAAVNCPFCNSANTSLTSQFGSTACKALYFCNHCHQPFEHFKCH